MKRNAQGRPAKRASAAAGKSAVKCRALVLVDGSDIRKKIKKDYDKAARELKNSRQQLDRFHKADAPEFSRWLNTRFGALLTELRETAHKAAADEQLVLMVRTEYLFGGGSLAQAYQRIIKARENPEPPPKPPGGRDGGDSDRKRKSPGGAADFDDFDGEEDAAEAFFEERFGEAGPDEDPWSGQPAPGERQVARPQASARLKELNRALVRRLHPDTRQEMTPQKAEWWHQTQTAYQNGDVEQLEVILTLCEIDDSGTTAQTSASLLHRIIAQMKSSLREIKRQISAYRRDPAWGFSERTDQEAAARQMRGLLTRDLQELQYRWREARELIASWKAAAEKIRKPRRRKERPVKTEGMEFPF